MALSKDDKMRGLIVASGAFRAKFRLRDADDRPIKMKLQIKELGVHPDNRGGVYPTGRRCVQLTISVLQKGFSTEEVSHACVAVEETNVEEAIRIYGQEKCKTHTVPAYKYNHTQCKKDELLECLFDAPYDKVTHTLLSHNHIMLVMRAFLTRAKWDIPPDAEKRFTACTEDGKCSLAAVAACANGSGLAEMLRDGIECEVMTWRMNFEEPSAAACISTALNEPQQLAMRTSELSAIKLLKGEIISQMGPNLDQQVAYRAVTAKLRLELNDAANDPDLQEVFDFLMHTGVGRNRYLDDLLDWAQSMVVSSMRQLRLGAFGVCNKMPREANWSKCAVIKRAYKQPPQHGFCPSPESLWGLLKWNEATGNFAGTPIEFLEDLLRFFHVGCNGMLETLPKWKRVLALGNIDIQATNEFFNAAQADQKKKPKGRNKLQQTLLDATRQYAKDIGLDIDDDEKYMRNGIQGMGFPRAEWIRFKKEGAAQEPASARAPAATGPISIKPIEFDEATGKAKNSQVSFESRAGQKVIVRPPLAEWCNTGGRELGLLKADQAAAVAVIGAIHEGFNLVEEPVELAKMSGTSTLWVVAKEDCTTGEIMLPPCNPRKMEVVSSSVHPFPAVLEMRVMASGTGSTDTSDSVKRRRTMYVHPEVCLPAEVPAKDAGETDSPAEPDWQWSTENKESMHPFWIVRRLSPSELERAKADARKQDKPIPRFNMTTINKTVAIVTNSVVKGTMISVPRQIDVPFMTNSVDITQGEELIIEIPEKKDDSKNKKRQRTWREEQSAADAAQARAKMKKSGEAA